MKVELLQLKQVSDTLSGGHNVPSVPKDGWLRTLRTTLKLSTADAAKRAKVTPMAWTAAEKRETEGTISLETLGKFLGALGYSLSYCPVSETSLEDKLRKQAYEFVKKEILGIRSTMSLENQAPGNDFTERAIKERTEDIIRSGNWK